MILVIALFSSQYIRKGEYKIRPYQKGEPYGRIESKANMPLLAGQELVHEAVTMKSSLRIVLLVVASMASLFVLDEYIPIGGGLSWSWLLYLIGGTTIFVIYTRRLKSKAASESKGHGTSEESGPTAPPENDRSEMDRIRLGIRRRKDEIRSKK